MNKSKLLATAFVVASLSFSSAQAKSMCSFNSKGEMVASYKTSGCDKHEKTNRNQIDSIQKRVVDLNKEYFSQKAKLDGLISDINVKNAKKASVSSEKEKAKFDAQIQDDIVAYNKAVSALNIAIGEISDLSAEITKFTNDEHEISRVTKYNVYSPEDYK